MGISSKLAGLEISDAVNVSFKSFSTGCMYISQ